MISRLKRAGFNIDALTGDDYPEIKAKLGWAESTYKTALCFLGKGKEAKQLSCPMKDYIPTQEDIAAIESSLGSFGKSLIFLGCRIGEMWTITINNSYATIRTSKHGVPVTLNLEIMGTRERNAIIEWSWTKNRFTIHQIRYAWARLKREGKIDKRCDPHSFRHRLISNLAQNGYTAEQITLITGHRAPSSLYRYMHGNPTHATEARMFSSQLSRRVKLSRWHEKNQQKLPKLKRIHSTLTYDPNMS
jgi:hypothetical protein